MLLKTCIILPKVFANLPRFTYEFNSHLIPNPWMGFKMISVHFLQLLQLRFIWEGCPQNCGMCLQGIFSHSSKSVLVVSHTDVDREGLALSLRSHSSQKCSIGFRLGLQGSQVHPYSVQAFLTFLTKSGSCNTNLGY